MTRRKNLTRTLVALLVDHGVHLVQTADGLTRETHDRLKELAAALVALILATDFSNQISVSVLIAQTRAYISAAYGDIAARSNADMTDLASVEARALVSIVNGAVGSTALRVPRLTVTPAFGGMPLGNWWEAQATDTASRVASFLRAAVSVDTAAEDVAHNLTSTAGPMPTAERYAETLIHSTVQRIATDARQAVLKANAGVVVGYEIAETLDSRTCAQCLAYDGSTYDLEGAPTGGTVLPLKGGPHYHMNCRGMVVPIMADQSQSGGLTAEEWLDAKTPAEQDDILGKGRAALYRKGSLTLRDLVSGTGQQLSLAQLREKYNANP